MEHLNQIVESVKEAEELVAVSVAVVVAAAAVVAVVAVAAVVVFVIVNLSVVESRLVDAVDPE